jgi:hypothetical protein
MKTVGYVSSFLFVFLLVGSVSAATPLKNMDGNYIGLRLGYGFTMVSHGDNSSSYDQTQNRRVMFGVTSCFKLIGSHRNALVLYLPIDLDVSYRFSNMYGEARHTELLLDVASQLGLDLDKITPFIGAGPTLCLSRMKYEVFRIYYDYNQWDQFGNYNYYFYQYKDKYFSQLYGVNVAVGCRVNLSSILGQLKLQYRFLKGSKKPLAEETKEYLESISENRQTLDLVGSTGFRMSRRLYGEVGMKIEKSKDRFKYNYKSYDYWPEEEKWGEWSKWSKGELRIFLGIGIMI